MIPRLTIFGLSLTTIAACSDPDCPGSTCITGDASTGAQDGSSSDVNTADGGSLDTGSDGGSLDTGSDGGSLDTGSDGGQESAWTSTAVSKRDFSLFQIDSTGRPYGLTETGELHRLQDGDWQSIYSPTDSLHEITDAYADTHASVVVEALSYVAYAREPEWVEDVVLTGSFSRATLADSPTRTVVVISEAEGNDHLTLYERTDTEWVVQELPTVGEAEHPIARLDSAGRLHIVYSNLSTLPRTPYYLYETADGFESEEIPSSDLGTFRFNDNGRAAITGGQNVFVREESGWETRELSNGGAGLRVALDSTGSPVVAFTRFEGDFPMRLPGLNLAEWNADSWAIEEATGDDASRFNVTVSDDNRVVIYYHGDGADALSGHLLSREI